MAEINHKVGIWCYTPRATPHNTQCDVLQRASLTLVITRRTFRFQTSFSTLWFGVRIWSTSLLTRVWIRTEFTFNTSTYTRCNTALQKINCSVISLSLYRFWVWDETGIIRSSSVSFPEGAGGFYNTTSSYVSRFICHLKTFFFFTWIWPQYI